MPLPEKSLLVLRTVAEGDMDGFSLASKTGLEIDDLRAAIFKLRELGYLRVEGLDAGILRAWYQAVPGALNMLKRMP